MDAGMGAIDAVIDAERRMFRVCADALRRVRIAAGLTQLGLAERSGMDVATISAVERGSREQVRALTLARLAEALDVSPGELLVGLSDPEGSAEASAGADTGGGSEDGR